MTHLILSSKVSDKYDLIICFGGMLQSIAKIPPFEFLHYLSSQYTGSAKAMDLIFVVDQLQCWYHCGLKGITASVEETVVYLNDIISERPRNRVLFMGCSAGGYAAILFGSLCKGVDHVIAFCPQTTLVSPIDRKYGDLKPYINESVHYTLVNSPRTRPPDDLHHLSHCHHLSGSGQANIKLRLFNENLKQLRDNGVLKKLLDNAFT